MTLSPDLRSSPRRLATLFILVSAVPLAALAWLTWRVVIQDRALEAQRSRERLATAAIALTRELEQDLQSWDELLTAAAQGQSVGLPENAVVVVMAADGVVSHHGARLPYYPAVAGAPLSRISLFDAAEVEEFQRHDFAAAAVIYRRLVASPHPGVRAEALVRLARCLRRLDIASEALAAYAAMIDLGATTVGGVPAALVGRAERIKLLQAGGNTMLAAAEQRQLAAILREGRFVLDRGTFDFFSTVAAGEPGAAGSTDALAMAVAGFWDRWRTERSGRGTWTSETGTFVSVWRHTPAGAAAIAAPVDSLLSPLATAARDLAVRVGIKDRSGHRVWGEDSQQAVVSQPVGETGLPWAITLASTVTAQPSLASSRERLIAAAFVLMVLVVSAASYFVFAAVNRELGVARLQSDFVAAVSHEFRTPLTAMRHLTEMLEQGAVERERLADYFSALGRETRRLHAMVETLLDFARIDAGRRVYQCTPTDPDEMVRTVAREVADTAPASARRIEADLPEGRGTLSINVDRDAMALALRNLLDNALKYSKAPAAVRMAVTSSRDAVAISVEDQGAGIGVEERSQIFRRFTRGAAARDLNVKGTGIGLTMAHEIVVAHGGRLEVESEPGRGSVFTIVIPVLRT